MENKKEFYFVEGRYSSWQNFELNNLFESYDIVELLNPEEDKSRVLLMVDRWRFYAIYLNFLFKKKKERFTKNIFFLTLVVNLPTILNRSNKVLGLVLLLMFVSSYSIRESLSMDNFLKTKWVKKFLRILTITKNF